MKMERHSTLETAASSDYQVEYTKPAPQLTRTDTGLYTLPSSLNSPHSDIPKPGGLAIEKEVSWRKQWKLPVQKLSRRALLIIVGCVIGALMAISIGVGVGVGLRARKSDPQTSVPSQISETNDDRVSIMSDSSLASVTTKDGSRYLFYQDQSGSIRRATYTESGREWLSYSNPSSIMTHDARPGTPISAQVYEIRLSKTVMTQIYVHFLDVNNRLSSLTFSSDASNPRSLSHFSTLSSNYTCSPDAKSLFVSYRAINSTAVESYVALELPDSEVALIRGGMRAIPRKDDDGEEIKPGPDDIPGPDQGPWEWEDMTQVLSQFDSKADGDFVPSKIYQNVSISPDITKVGFAAPFTGALRGIGGSPDQFIDIAFFDPTGSYTDGSGISYFSSNHTDGTTFIYLDHFPFIAEEGFTEDLGSTSSYTQESRPFPYDVDSIQASDFVWPGVSGHLDLSDPPEGGVWTFSGLWVNGTTLSFFEQTKLKLSKSITRIRSEFPYRRLATTTPDKGEQFFLYHQINETTIAEDVYYYTVKEWDVHYIEIKGP